VPIQRRTSVRHTNVYPHTDWNRLLNGLQANWRQGEHVSIIGPTGCGKTTLESRLLDVRDSVVVFVTKIYDDTISRDFPGYERIEKWPPPRTWQNKVLLWPRPEGTIRETYRKQRGIFKDALDRIFRERNWCVVFDEQHYMCKQLGLDVENAMLLQQGRSSGLSVVNGTQRPSWVPVVTYSSATHAMIWRTTFRDDLRRLSELGGVDMRELQANLLRLGKHDFIYVNTRRGDIMRSQVNL
jgi:hypothetical protein